MPSAQRPLKQPLPWKQSLGLGRREEDVRPIFWRNRNKSYVARTQEWDEFPNGRWGDSRSPAFGELDAYGIGLTGLQRAEPQEVGWPQSLNDVANLFIRYIDDEIEYLHRSEAPLASEAESIKDDLLSLNRRGLFTVNSQPSVNGVKSTASRVRLGPSNGDRTTKGVPRAPRLSRDLPRDSAPHPRPPRLDLLCADKVWQPLHTNAPAEGPNAVTWGCVPWKGDCAAYDCREHQFPGVEGRGFPAWGRLGQVL